MFKQFTHTADFESAAATQTEKYITLRNLDATFTTEHHAASDTTVTTIFFGKKPDPIHLSVFARIWLDVTSKNTRAKYTRYSVEENSFTIYVANTSMRHKIFQVLSTMAKVHAINIISDGFKIFCSPRRNRVDLLYDELEKLRAIKIPGVSYVADVRQIVEHSKSKLIIRVNTYHQPK